mmetsp:Transcript_15350/g.34432  ORF Transcript_15350/g.34432 Transcript_15350/m.34432 type:complete len:98 (-) Transcript_15350:1330-1623(-)
MDHVTNNQFIFLPAAQASFTGIYSNEVAHLLTMQIPHQDAYSSMFCSCSSFPMTSSQIGRLPSHVQRTLNNVEQLTFKAWILLTKDSMSAMRQSSKG